MIGNLATHALIAAGNSGKQAAARANGLEQQRAAQRRSARRQQVNVPCPLDDIRTYVDAVVYATDQQKDAMILTFAVTHNIKPFNTLPRVLITSMQKESGKTTWLDLATYLCQNPWMTDPTSYALRSKFNEPERPTPLCDEISKIFGEAGLRGLGSPLYKLLVESYRKSATISMSVDRSAVDVSTFCVAICAGLRTAAPDDLRSRSIRIYMKPAPENMRLEDSLDVGVEAVGRLQGRRLHAWMAQQTEILSETVKEVRRFHPKLRSRRAQIWGPLFAVAEAAGGDWPERCRSAFVALALDADEQPILSAEQQVLMDAASFLRAQDQPRHLTSAELLSYLYSLDSELYPAQTERQMAIMMTSALGEARVLTLPDRRKAKGWHAKAVLAKAEALEAELMPDDLDEEEDLYDSFFEVTETTETTVVSA